MLDHGDLASRCTCPGGSRAQGSGSVGRALLPHPEDFRFLPGGRIQAGAGTARNVTLFNCFVMGTIEDSIPASFAPCRKVP